ncbi:MAG: hypothetical protein ACI3XR_02490 [Eubacteriales bacterium]
MTTNSDPITPDLPVSEPQKTAVTETPDAKGKDCAVFSVSAQELKEILYFLCRSGYNFFRIMAIVIPCFTALCAWDGNTGVIPCMILVEIFIIVQWVTIRSWINRSDSVGNQYVYTLTDQGLECEVTDTGSGSICFRFNPDKITHYRESDKHLFFTYNRTVFFLRKSAVDPASKITDYIRTNADRNTPSRKKGK